MGYIRPDSAVTVAAVVGLSVLSGPAAFAMDRGGSAGQHGVGQHSKSKSPTRADHRAVKPRWLDSEAPAGESPAEKVLRESLVAGHTGQEDRGVLKAIATNPKRPELDRLPASLPDKNDVIAEMFQGGPGSTATVGALVRHEGEDRPYAGQRVAHKLTLETSLTTGGKRQVVATDLDDNNTTYTFVEGHSVNVPGWHNVHGEVRVRLESANTEHLALDRLEPFVLTSAFRPSLGMGDTQRFVFQNRQLLGKHEEALNAFYTKISSSRQVEELFAPAKFEALNSTEELDARLEGSPDGYRGILRDSTREFFHVIRHRGKTYLYNEYADPEEPSDVEGQVAFLPRTEAALRWPAQAPRPNFSTLPADKWMPTTHDEAIRLTTETRDHGTVTVAGMLRRDIPRLDKSGKPVGILHPRGTQIQWSVFHRGDGIGFLEKIGAERLVGISPEQFRQHTHDWPTVNTFIRHGVATLP